MTLNYHMVNPCFSLFLLRGTLHSLMIPGIRSCIISLPLYPFSYFISSSSLFFLCIFFIVRLLFLRFTHYSLIFIILFLFLHLLLSVSIILFVLPLIFYLKFLVIFSMFMSRSSLPVFLNHLFWSLYLFSSSCSSSFLLTLLSLLALHSLHPVSCL